MPITEKEFFKIINIVKTVKTFIPKTFLPMLYKVYPHKNISFEFKLSVPEFS